MPQRLTTTKSSDAARQARQHREPGRQPALTPRPTPRRRRAATGEARWSRSSECSKCNQTRSRTTRHAESPESGDASSAARRTEQGRLASQRRGGAGPAQATGLYVCEGGPYRRRISCNTSKIFSGL